MVNFFDVATPGEIERQFEERLTPEELAYERAILEKNPDKNCAYLFWLYLNRGKEEKANEYLNLISDPEYRQSIIDITFGLQS